MNIVRRRISGGHFDALLVLSQAIGPSGPSWGACGFAPARTPTLADCTRRGSRATERWRKVALLVAKPTGQTIVDDDDED